jgi:hypothetical protein
VGVNDVQRVKLKVKTWDVSTGKGTVVDRAGCEYPIFLSRLGKEFHVVQPRPTEVLEGIVLGPDEVVGLVSVGTERINFESVGANPDDAIATLRGLALEGGRPQRFGTPDTGRFSNPRDQKDGRR